MDMKARLDPELVGPLEGILGAMGGGLNLRDIPATRMMLDGLITAVKAEAPKIDGVETEDRLVPGFEREPEVAVRLYRPTGRDEALPALLWMHGGGWVLGNLELDDLMAKQLAKDVGCVVVAVNYRLAPEHVFPAALHDCRAALEWLADHADTMRVDRSRIAIGGASAGGNLAAALALMARDQGGFMPAFQLLIYPALDNRNVEPASDMRPDGLFWTRENGLLAWRAYLGREPASADVSLYAAPIHATNLEGLPPAYIPVPELDFLLDENIDYARRLSAAGVATELHVYPGAFHAFDVFGAGARIAQQFSADRDAVLRRALHR
jgi:acetyl esterase/lipase